jgi:hypothetical protein
MLIFKVEVYLTETSQPNDCEKSAAICKAAKNISQKSMLREARPQMSTRFSNRHAEYVASGECPDEWYGVL